MRIVAIAVWVAFAVWVATWEDAPPAVIVGTAIVVFGVLVGRWWAVLVPLAPGLLLALMILLGESHELQMPSVAAYAALYTIGMSALVALGVALDHFARALTGGSAGR
jgi:hypothetical protein